MESLTKMLAVNPKRTLNPKRELTLSQKRLAHPNPKNDAGCKTVILKLHVGSERAGQAHNRESQNPGWQAQTLTKDEDVVCES